jgi:hypothetical protein
MLMLIALGMSATIARAVFQALRGKAQVFVRTPKYGMNNRSAGEGYSPPFDLGLLLELGLALYAAAGVWVAVENDNSGALLLLITVSAGFTYVGLHSLGDRLHSGR